MVKYAGITLSPNPNPNFFERGKNLYCLIKEVDKIYLWLAIKKYPKKTSLILVTKLIVILSLLNYEVVMTPLLVTRALSLLVVRSSMRQLLVY